MPILSARWTPPCSPSSSPFNGERCTAGSRIFIQQSIYPEFVKRFAERANRLRVGDPTDPNTQVGALISQQHWKKSPAISVWALKKAPPCWRAARINRLTCLHT
ncbi:aldehyde dehydrogenase family protein [Escherichia coli]